MFDYLVFIGRFQPFHLGHQSVVAEALSRCREVILLCGSAGMPRSTRNPFSVEERRQMILGAFAPQDAERIHVVALEDRLYNDTRWVQQVQQAVQQTLVAAARDNGIDPAQAQVGLIGHRKDSSSYYLSLFPRWDDVGVDNFHGISSTPIRDSYLLGALPRPDLVPDSTFAFLREFQQTPAYQALWEEAGFIDRYKKQWEQSPYPPTFVTVDAVVVQSGHVLLVERAALPGKGLWALPGGFIDPQETLLEGCLRELREETRLKVPEPVLRGSLKAQRTFDDPFRSARGRTITQAFFFQLRNDPDLPKVKGHDDARQAFWVPLADLNASRLFEDHYAIICELAGL